MLFTDDIIYNISNLLSIYYFRYCKTYMLINKTFYTHIKFFLTNFNNKSEFKFYMATQLKHWRPELNFPEVLYNNFMIFDNSHSYLYWKNNSIEYHNFMEGLQNNIISYTFYKQYMCDYEPPFQSDFPCSNIYYNLDYLEFIEYIDNYSILHNDFNTYFIYYFTHIDDPRSLSFIICPFFDEYLTQISCFLYYQIVKKNTLHNHNLNWNKSTFYWEKNNS